MKLDKTQLRQQCRALRQNITAIERKKAAHHAAMSLAALPIFQQANHIACYLPTNTEFDVTPIITTIWQAQKNCYVPIVQADKTLRFVRYADGDELQPNRYSILEPVNNSRDIAISELDLVIVPLLAFDRRGQRLGAGGGYYDRTFAQSKTTLLGVGYAAQETTDIPADPWDVRLSAVLTEKEYIKFREKQKIL